MLMSQYGLDLGQWMVWAFVPMFGWGFLAPLALGALSFFKGAKKGQQKTTSKSTSTSTPTLAPEYKGLQGLVLPSIERRLQQPYQLPRGFVEGGISDINRTHNLVQQGLKNKLTAQGMGASPAMVNAPMVRAENARAGDIVRFQRDIPLIERDMQNQDLQMALAAMAQGRGYTSTGEGTSTTDTGQGGILGGLGSLAEMLMYQYGNGGFGKIGGGGVPPYRIPQGGTVYTPYPPGRSF